MVAFLFRRPLKLLLCLSVVMISVMVVAHARDPYRVLGVSRTATDADIRQRYRQLCLEYHPDKHPKHQRAEYERLFKELQTAHSQIRNAEARREYHQNEMFQRRHKSNYYNYGGGGGRTAVNNPEDAFREAFSNAFRSYQQQQQSPFAPSGSNNSFYRFNVNSMFDRDGSFGGGGGGMGSPTLNPFASSPLKSIYVEKVTVPLQDLYTGKSHYEFTVHDNILARTIAAFRGGIGYVILYQSILYAIPLIRISRKLALGLGLYLFHRNLPTLAGNSLQRTEYAATIRPGYKGGTKFTFDNNNNTAESSGGIEIQFILKEAKHPVYKRMGNDLHASCTITRRQAETGCRVDLPSLHDPDFVLPVHIPAGTVSGDTVRVIGKGWPHRNKNKKKKGLPQRNDDDSSSSSNGDLIVTVVVSSRWTRRHKVV